MREPELNPFTFLAQSVSAADHSPTTVNVSVRLQFRHEDLPIVHLSELARVLAYEKGQQARCAWQRCRTHGIAHQTEMLVNRHGHQTGVEDLVFVMIDNHILCVVVLRGEEPIHPGWLKEAIVQHDRSIANLAEIIVGVTVKVLDHALVQLGQEGLVQGLYRDNHVLHRRYCILLLDFAESCMSVAKTISIAPARRRCPVAAVVEAILRLGCTVEVDDYFQASLSRPANGGLKIRGGALRVGTPGSHVTPVADGYAHKVETSVLDLPEVVESYKAVPMRFEHIGTGLLPNLLAKCPLIDDGRVRCAVTFENGGRDKTVVVNI